MYTPTCADLVNAPFVSHNVCVSAATSEPTAPLPIAVLEALVAIVGREHVLIDPDITRSYSHDWSGRYSGTVYGVVRPGSTDEVAEVPHHPYR